MQVGDQVITKHEDNATAVLDFYERLIGAEYDREKTISLEALGSPRFNLDTLDLPFSEEEVWNTIKEMPLDKAPGPDGFTGRFYKCCWSIIKNDVLAAVIFFGPEISEISRN